MTAREDVVRRHPSRVARLIDAAQDEQAIEASRRDLTDVEIYSGGPMWAINEKHHEVSTGPRAWLLDIGVPFLIALVIFGVIWGSAFLGEMFGGWPL